LRHLQDQDCVRQGLLTDYNPTLVKDPSTDWQKVARSKARFCNFIFSNAHALERLRLFELLSKYRKVDAGGPLRNNVGYNVKHKLPFISDYKFTIAYENSSFPGYATEKLVEPMIVNSIPIYWGDPMVTADFNVESFVCANGRSVDDVVAEIVELDRNPDLYAAKLAQPWFDGNVQNRYFSLDYVADFFQKIVVTSLPPEKQP
jgi:alpha(1,3/1,4) fucosyltransferase